ncbi:hypothetical protein BJ944DRAFT_228371 [Cunninghamella echinulata]|nr:hypothetical protein BJ944DRAFT_228371 [Cunninghamella echinulata]
MPFPNIPCQCGIYSFKDVTTKVLKKWNQVDRLLVNHYSKIWPYHSKLKEIQFNPKSYRDTFIFIVPDKSCFSQMDGGTDYPNFAQGVHDAINTANNYGLSFKGLTDVIDKYSEDYKWKMSVHTISGAGQVITKGAGTKAPYRCWESYKWTYVTVGPVDNYLFDTKIIQGWHEQNEKARGRLMTC